MLSNEAREIIARRGLDLELMEKMGVTSSDRMSGVCISFPYFKNGIEVNHKYRRLDEKEFCQDGNAVKCVYNFDCLLDENLSGPVIITEGEFDAISAIQAGFLRTVSVPDGAPKEEIGDNESSKKYSYIKDVVDVLKDCKEIILAVDSDGPGINLLNDLALQLGKYRCKWVKYPKGCKDLNDALMRYGLKGVQATIERAQWMNVSGIFKMSELPPLPDAPPFSSKIEGMDEHMMLRMGDFWVITGIPGHGKTAFVNDLTCRIAETYGWHITIASFEQKPQIDHLRNLRRWKGSKFVNKMSDAELRVADDWIDEHFTFIVPGEDDDATVPWTLERAAASIVRNESRVLIIDPWNEMDHLRAPDQSLTEYVGFAIKQFKKFAAKYRVLVIVVAHPAKLLRNKEGEFPIPSLYDISDCYSDDTEVLTKRGWILHQDITINDDVMCFDPKTGESRYENPSQVVSYPYEGDMFNFKGYGYDVLVSPNHKMVVKAAWKEPIGNGSGRGRPVKWPKGEWVLTKATDIGCNPYVIPKSGSIIDGDDPDFLLVNGVSYPAEEFCEFIGWWVAEGCLQSSGVSICQSVGDNSDRLDAVIQALGIHTQKKTAKDHRGFLDMNTWYIGVTGNRPLVEWIQDKCGEKSGWQCIPYPFFNLSPRLKSAFLNGFLLGDGSLSKHRGTLSATTSSKKLRDDLMRLSIELGIGVTSNIRKKGKDHHSESYQINFAKKGRTEVAMRGYRNVSVKPYLGNIWCLTVPTGAYFVRRNGAVVVSGNSAHWANKPDLGVVVHRMGEKESLVRVTKSRYHDIIGKPGEKTFTFNQYTGRFELVQSSEF